MENQVHGVAAPERRAADPVKRSAFVLLGLAAPATLFLTFWTAPLPAIGVIAILWAAGLGLLTRRPVGLWLGRLGATVLVLTGIYVGWNVVTWLLTLEGTWRTVNIVLFGALSALLVGAGIGVLWALRPRSTVHEQAQDVTGSRPQRPTGTPTEGT